MNYCYCSIQVEGYRSSYFYISGLGMLETCTYVEVPFGTSNVPMLGVVINCVEYAEDAVPFPLARTKYIRRVLTAVEYEAEMARRAAEAAESDGDDAGGETFEDVDDMVLSCDCVGIIKWLEEHFSSNDPAVLKQVVRCLNFCVEQNYAEAALNLGSLYYLGRGVKQSYSEAFRLYKIAADAGELRAMCNLGYCYYYGREREVDFEMAHHYFELGALLYNDANCLYKLGDMYLNGYYVDMNKQYAFILYDRAHDSILQSKDDDCLPDVLFRLGKCCVRGIGTARDVKKGNELLHIALLKFYDRIKTDPFIGELIRATKELIAEAEAIIEGDMMKPIEETVANEQWANTSNWVN